MRRRLRDLGAAQQKGHELGKAFVLAQKAAGCQRKPGMKTVQTGLP